MPIQTAIDSISQNQGSPFGFKNRIINGGMGIDQRNAGASGTASTYTVDRWGYYGAQSAKGTWQQNAGSVTPPSGFTNYLGFTSSSAYSVLSTDQFFLYQTIEGLNCSDLNWGSATPATVTLSFWVRSSLTGTFGGVLQNNGATRNYPFSFTINSANTWEKETITIRGDTTGTWLTTSGWGIRVAFNLGTGATYSSTANQWTGTNFITAPTGAVSVVGTNGATFYVTGVQLEVGNQASSFDYRPYGTEFALCQRYYERGIVGFVGYLTSGIAGGTGVPFAVTKRAAATMSQAASLNASGMASGVGSYFVTGVDGVALYHTATVTGNVSFVDRYIADAEL